MTTSYKEVYLVAAEAAEPLAPEVVREAFEGEEVDLNFDEPGVWLIVKSDTTRVEVRFETGVAPLGWSPDLLIGTPERRERLAAARGF